MMIQIRQYAVKADNVYFIEKKDYANVVYYTFGQQSESRSIILENDTVEERDAEFAEIINKINS